ncbi:MAG: hypothetical protein HC886_12270 [Leptolyngbyaceae cyanobacterium SM1_1_3]|nr:hypothetical protein [Leptolyngbyaceae cyanobacterium SM1_1_3]
MATAGAITYSTAAQVPVPTDAAVDSTAYYIAKDPTITKKVDQDGDGNADYAAQIFRVAAKATNSTAFTMGVRVYDLAAAENPDSLSDDPTGTARLGMTGSRGERDRLPLASVYASIAREGSDSLCGYIEYLTESPASTAAEFTCD